ncbi:uncharacterized protein [Chelonus insularis]|uniref:uncharacterized protein n=1 Tax=Chelonus insularis TaxID=460826 RepID=UPI00158A0F28|nr:uncharacterized protein LOC118064758 [Chelonus insularis]
MTSHKPRQSNKENFPVTCLSTIFGIRPARLCKTLWIGYIYMLIVIILYYVLFYSTMDYAKELYNIMECVSFTAIRVRKISTIFNIFFLPLMIISSAINFNKVRNSRLDLNELDQKLQLFNSNIYCAKSMWKNSLYVCGILLFTNIMGLAEYYNLKNANSNYMYNLMWLSNIFPQIVNSVAISGFVVIVADVTRRYQLMNEIILDLRVIKKEVSALSQDVNNVFQFKLLKQCYVIFSNIIIKINEAYGFIILLTIIICCFGMCAHLLVVVQTFGDKSYLVDFTIDLLWTFFYFGKLAYIVNICHHFQLEGKRASKILHEYKVDSDNHLLKQESESFAHQVRNVDVQITACNFFNIDYPLLCKVVLGMTAYVFFLSQFTRRTQ